MHVFYFIFVHFSLFPVLIFDWPTMVPSPSIIGHLQLKPAHCFSALQLQIASFFQHAKCVTSIYVHVQTLSKRNAHENAGMQLFCYAAKTSPTGIPWQSGSMVPRMQCWRR